MTIPKRLLDATRAELKRLQALEERGIVVGLEIVKPKPWPPAAMMLRLRREGVDVRETAKKTGYSVPTVERNLKTGGEHATVGPQCDRHAGKVFSAEQAMGLMPIPCSETCVCSWRPILRSDIKRR